MLDFNDYPQDSNIFDHVNKKVAGEMTHECKGKIISEFFRLKSKIYSLLDVDHKENKKAKRVNKNDVRNIRQKECIDVKSTIMMFET